MGRVTGQQALFIGVLLLMVCLATSCRNADSGADDTPDRTGVILAQTGGENLHRVTLHITGMSWGAWPRIVRLVLERLDGVAEAKVSFKEKQAVVTYEPKKVTVQQMIEAVTRSGFGAKRVP